jgi:hypothetical protein
MKAIKKRKKNNKIKLPGYSEPLKSMDKEIR